MVVKIFAIAILLLVLEITFLSTQEPITLELKKSKIAFSDVTFEHVQAYLITTEGMRGLLKAAEAQSFGTTNELSQIDATLFFKDHHDYITADRARYTPDRLHLFDHIVYDSNHSLLFKSDDLVYNIQNGIVTSHKPFTLDKDGAHAEGDSLLYDTKKRFAKAEKIRFTINEKE